MSPAKPIGLWPAYIKVYKMTKLIRVDEWTAEIIRLDAIRQSSTPNTLVTRGGVLRQFAKKLNKKHKYIK